MGYINHGPFLDDIHQGWETTEQLITYIQSMLSSRANKQMDMSDEGEETFSEGWFVTFGSGKALFGF